MALSEAKRIDFTYVGSPQVLEHIASRARRDTCSDIKTAIIVPGGGMRGALQAGFMEAASSTGFLSGSDMLIAASVGAPVAVGAATGSDGASEIFYRDNFRSDGMFIRLNLGSLLQREIIDFQGLEESFRRHLRTESLSTYPSPVDIGITPVQGEHAGEIQYIDARNHPDVIQLIMASLNIPVVGNIKTTNLDGINYNDTAIPASNMIDHAIEQGAQDILVVGNEMFNPSRFNRIWSNVQHKVGEWDRSPLRRVMLQAAHEGIKGMDNVVSGKIVLENGEEVRLGMIMPRENIVNFLERNWQLLRRAVNDSREAGERLFAPLMDGQDALSLVS